MINPLRVCLHDSAQDDAATLRIAFEGVPNTIILSTSSDWPELREWMRHAKADLVVINLDGPDNADLDVVRRASQLAPGCGIIGVSKRHDPATIIAATRAGCTQFVCAPIDKADLLEAVERIRAVRVTVTRESKRICVLGSSGGAGVTSIACNLAIELAHLQGEHCTVVDLNLEFGDVACALDCSPKYSISDVCQEGMEADRTMLTTALHELPCGIAVLARPEQLQDVTKVTPQGVREMLRVLAQMSPYVVVDLPRSLDPISHVALEGADRILLVTQLGVPFIRNASRMYKGFKNLGLNPDAVDLVLNRCTSTYEPFTIKDVESHFGKPLFAAIPNDYRRMQMALDSGHPILADAPETPSRLAIHRMARQIAGLDPEADSQKAGAGVFSRVWAKLAGPNPASASN